MLTMCSLRRHQGLRPEVAKRIHASMQVIVEARLNHPLVHAALRSGLPNLKPHVHVIKEVYLPDCTFVSAMLLYMQRA